MAAGTGRLDAAALNGVPQVVSVGAADMITFGERESLLKNIRIELSICIIRLSQL